jgi:hypothetical protein
MGHANAENRAPGAAREDDLVLPQVFAQELGDLEAVVGHALDGNRRLDGFAVLEEGPARVALVPVDEREIPFPARIQRVGDGALGTTGPAVQDQHDRLAAIRALDRDPLLEAADRHVHRFIDRRAVDGLRRRPTREHGPHESEQGRVESLRHSPSPPSSVDVPMVSTREGSDSLQ